MGRTFVSLSTLANSPGSQIHIARSSANDYSHTADAIFFVSYMNAGMNVFFYLKW